jgi:hypothetical protein
MQYDSMWGSEEVAGITVAVHVAPFASPSLLVVNPWIYVGVAGVWDITNAVRTNIVCTKRVYGDN